MKPYKNSVFNNIEYFLYELRPHFYAALAVYAFCNYNLSKIMILSGGLLAVASFSVFELRREHREKIIR